MTALVAIDEDPVRPHRRRTSSTPSPSRSRADDAGRRRRSGRSRSRRCPTARWSSRCSGPTRAAPMIYDDLRVVDLHDAASRARTAPSCSPISAPTSCSRRRSTIRCSSTCARRNGTRPTSAAGSRGADIVLVGEPGSRRRRLDPLVTVSITPVGHGGPDDGLDLPEEVLQARSGSLSNHGHADRPPLTVGGHLGEYVTGAFAALGAATAWWRASRTGVAEHVDVSMLEAMQMTFVTAPTLMARVPGRPAGDVPLGDDPRQRADRRRPLRRHHDGHDAAVAVALPRRWAATTSRATTSSRRCSGAASAADEVNAHPARLDDAHDRGRDRRRAASTRACRRRSSATAPSCPRFDHLVAREVFVRQPGEAWIRPRAPFRFHGVPDRELAAPGRQPAHRGPRVRHAERAAPRVGDRPLAGLRVLDFTAFWAGPVRHGVARGDGRRRDQGRSGAATRRHPVQRGGAPARRPAVLREVGAVPRCRTSASAASRSTSAIPTASPSRSSSSQRATSSSRTSRRACSSSSASTTTTVRALRPDVVMVRMPAFGLTGPWRDRPGFAQTMEQLTGMAWVTGYEDGPPIIPGGVVDPMVGTHAALALVAALEHRDRTGEGQLRRGAARRGRHGGDRRAGDPLLRSTARCSDRRGAGGVYRSARATTRGSRSTATRDPLAADERGGVVRDARSPTTRPPSCATAGYSGRGRGRPRTPRSTIRRLRARGFFETIEHAATSARRSTRRGRCASRPDRARSGPARRRRSGSTPKRCCATSSGAPTTSSTGCAPST